MKFDPEIHHRRSIRLKGYDYSQAGAYFVTIVAWQREMLFGDVVDGVMILNDYGKIVSEKWEWLETQYEYVELGAWIITPNHIHGILAIRDAGRGDSRIAPTPVKRKPLGGLIGAFKTVSSKHINLLRRTDGIPVWQRNYGACPEPVEGNISFETNAKWIGFPVTSNPIHCDGRRMTNIQ